MSGGADIEADVGLEVDGGPVFRAFDQIVARMQEIQGQVDQITSKAKAAAEAFGGTGLKTLQDFNKVISTLDRFQTNLQKSDPHTLALAQQAQQNKPVDRQVAQEAAMWAKVDRDRYAEQSKLNAQLEREELAREQEVQRIREQNELKILRDQKQLTAQQAEGIKELEALQVASATRIAELRRVRDTGSPEAERTALQLLAIEKQQLATVTSRIAAEQKASVSTVATRVSGQMDNRAAKLDEAASLADANLGNARVRVAELEAQIAANTERAHAATAAERAEIEKALVLDKERLAVADRQVAALEKQAQAEVRAAQPKPGTYGPPLPPGIKSPGSPGGGRPGGESSLLGKNGIMGVFAFSAAYGAAASVIYGVISTIKSGISEAIEFSDTLEKIGGVANITGTELEGVGKTIEDVAEHSKFARKDIADVALALAQAGYSAREIKEALGPLNTLAEATGSELKDVTEIVTGAIGAFQLSAQDTGRVANILTAALNGTRLTLKEVATGIQSVGEIANEQNQSLEDLTANLAAMAEAGLKGQQLGMGYRQVLIQLATPSKAMVDILKKLGLTLDDINVKTLGVTGVINNLTNAGFTSADAFKVFGARASSAFLALRDQQGIALKVALAQAQQTTAQDAAAKSMGSLTSQWQRFKNQLNDSTTNGLEPVTTALAHLFKTINDGADDPALTKLQDNLHKALTAGDGASTPEVEKARQALQDYKKAKEETTAAEEKHAVAIEATSSALKEATDTVADEQKHLGELDDALIRVSIRKETLTKDSSALAAETLNLEGQFQGLAAELQNTALSYDGLTKAMLNYRREQLGNLANDALAAVGKADAAIGASSGAARDDLHALHNSAGYAQLPANIRQAIETMRTSTGFDRAQAGYVVNNFLNASGGNIPPELAGHLRNYTTNVARTAGFMSQRDSANTIAGTATALGSPEFLNFANKMEATNSPAALRSMLSQAVNSAKGATGPTLGAWNQIISQLSTKLGMAEPPSPKNTPRHSNLENRQAAAEDAEGLKADKYALQDKINTLFGRRSTEGYNPDEILVTGKAPPLDEEKFKQNLAGINTALNDVIAARTKQFTDEMKRLKIDPNSTRGQNMLHDFQQEIDKIREDAKTKTTKEITDRLKSSVAKIENFYKDLQTGIDDQYDMVQARVSALSRQKYAGKGAGVPDYVVQTYERQGAIAKDTHDQQTLQNDEAELAHLQAVLDEFKKLKDDTARAKLLSDNDFKDFDELQLKVDTLRTSTDKLKASLQDGLVPTSFNAKLQMAIENYTQINHLQASWTDMIANDLTGAFSAGQSAFETFFQGILSGNATIGQSFGSLAKAVISYLTQMMAKMLAMKVMEIALNMFNPGGGSIASTPGYSQLASAHTSNVLSGLGFKINGGLIHALTGRYITDGVPNRDSVPAMIAKGEYVVRKSAVDSVGVDFMDKLNNRGLAALGGFGPKIVLPPPAHQQMSVYVVPPDQKPTMGPQDVLLTIADDIWHGGMTKQLIKQVSQGG